MDISSFIQQALAEDIKDGDHSTLSTIDAQADGRAVLKIKENGIIAGIDVATQIFKHVQPDCSFEYFKKDGEAVSAGEQAFIVSAKVHTILMCERLCLNIMQRMSGIASLTHQYVEKIKNYDCKILDTLHHSFYTGF